MGWLILATLLIVFATCGLVVLLHAIWTSVLDPDPPDPPPTPPPSRRVH